MNEKLNEQYYFLTESDNIKNSLNNILDINEINLDYLIMIVKLYNELIKDIEINKMEIYQNKLSIVKDFIYIFSSENNSKLYNLIDDMILNDNNLILGNSTFDKNKSNKLNKNQNDNIFLILKEYFIIQIIFFYIIILIALIKKNKNNYHSGLHNLTFYFHQNIIFFIYIIFSNFNINSNDKKPEVKNNSEKLIQILNENKAWLDKNNYKKNFKENNKLSKQILTNLLIQIKFFFKKNPYKENNNNFIENIINLLKSYFNSFKKRKIINILNEIKESPSFSYLLKIININKILSHYSEEKEENNVKEGCNVDDFKEYSPKPPFLKPISPKYKYTLVLDLDETLVHYISDNDSAYIEIRPGAEEFIKELSEYYEIIIFTAALKTYADLVIDGIDPDGVVVERLYRQHTISIGNANIKDLDKLGREIKHVIIIDNFMENFSLQSKNGLYIDDFEGNEYDDELEYLKKDLIELAKLNPDDIRLYLKDIQINMNKRAIYFEQFNNENNYKKELINGEENLFNEINENK